jgi:hypothetical protein
MFRRAQAILALLLVLAMAVYAQNTQPVNGDLAITLSLTPTVVKSGQGAKATLRMRNPRTNEQIQLQATATYTDSAGVQHTVQSNVVTLTIDYSLPVRISIPPDKVRLVPGTPKFDGVAIQPVSTGGIDFDIILPGDGADHTLELEVTK